MITKKYWLVSAAWLAWITFRVAAFAAPSVTNELQWGRPMGGLQMAAMVETNTGYVHCWIRNAGTNTMEYSPYLMGYWECTGIELYDVTTVRQLPRTTQGSRYVKGTYTRADQVMKQLLPMQTITNAPTYEDYADMRYGPLIDIDLPDGRKAKTRKFRLGILPPQKLGASFILDMANFAWPLETSAMTNIEIHAYQRLAFRGVRNNDEPMKLLSPPIRLDGRTVWEVLKKLRSNKPNESDYLRDPN